MSPIVPTEGRGSPTAFDAFGQKAPKLSLLLGKLPTARVLFIGTALAEWKDDFTHYFTTISCAESATELDSFLAQAPFDLIFLVPAANIGGVRHTAGLFDRLRTGLTPTGTLFFLVENWLSLTELAHNPFSVLTSRKSTARSSRSRLRRAGFDRIEEFLPLPRLLSAEEFVSSSHGSVVLPTDVSPIETALDKAGLLSFFHEGWAYFASGPQGGTSSFLEKLGEQLRGSAQGGHGVLLERFDLRNRGALVLLLRSVPGDRRFVCRITTDELTDRSVRRNADWTALIHRTPTISALVKAAVPRPVASFAINSGTAYIEDLVEGIIAWKLAGNSRLDAALFNGMLTFIEQLSRDTAVEKMIDEDTFTQLVESTHQLSVDDDTRNRMAVLTDRLRPRLLGTSRSIVWTHGDFGYGNAIADPRTGRVCGVIDWDQAREDLSGVDLLNFLLFRAHSLRDVSVTALFDEIVSRFVSGGFAAVDSRLHDEGHVAPGERGRVDLIALFALRIAQRVGIYPALFRASRAEINSLLDMACEALA